MDLVTGAMGSLVSKLGELLLEKYNLQRDARQDVLFLESELRSMHAALRKVAEVPRDQLDDQVKLWAGEVRELSYDMEDVVDTFLVRVDETAAGPDGFWGLLQGLKKKTVDLFNRGMARHQVADAMKEFKNRIQEVADRRKRYKVDDIVVKPAAVDPRVRALYTEAAELIGVHGRRDQELMKLLSEGDDASKMKLKIVSVVGFGGLGKTTLVKTVYDKIKGGFDCCAFVPVGWNPDVKKVFRDILFDLVGRTDPNLTILDERQLIDKLREFLENKRYLIVIDDIWDEKLWEFIECAFSSGNNLGSRLITTTRIVSVSKKCCSSSADSIYEMKPLSGEDSQRLFNRRIFEGESACPLELQEVSRDILKKCGGVPLAIITIASLLASDQHIKPKEEWHILLKSIGRGLTEDASAEEMQRILSFSYYDLPSHLKTCLLYLSIYPEDVEIEKNWLIWKWIAESFVQCERQETSLFEFQCLMIFKMYCGMSPTIIMFEPGALPRAEVIEFSFDVRMAKDGDGLGNLLRLREVSVSIEGCGVRAEELKEAEAAVRHAADIHPNHPSMEIEFWPKIPRGAADDYVLSVRDLMSIRGTNI